MVRVVSWNVNGLRACVRKGFVQWWQTARVDIVGLQEVRALETEIPEEVRALKTHHVYFSAAKRRGYSGVGLLSTLRSNEVETDLGSPKHDKEGRLQIARFGRLVVVNAYFPNGKGKEGDNSRIPFKLDFYRRLFTRLEPQLKQHVPIVVMGDFNTAHQEIDLARPKQNVKVSGFTPKERAEIDRWLAAGWTDTFRHFEKEPGHYTWWSSRFGVREKNVGWRIDYVLASPAAMPFVQRAFIWSDVLGSDHCPVGVDLDPKILE